ncbi:NUDIX domain-containing protein [Nonomuraea sp. NPDC046802]|uniref:NUDIX hydrolase n=1 Tax=Nonomuraea sp. NPDC046802 TaxID=3154919 RepID=UPI0033E995CC
MTVTHEGIRGVLARYLDAFPHRAPGVARLTHSLGPGQNISCRKTLPLHVTCSAAAIDHTGRVLMIRHRRLDRWVLPGGHISPSDRSLYDTALRKLEEETGISWRQVASLAMTDVMPVDIDVHQAPAHPARDTPEHWHADFRFAIRVRDTPDITLRPEEATAYVWREPVELPAMRLAAGIAAL